MRVSFKRIIGLVLALTLVFMSATVILSQDLIQQKQAKVKQINQIDAKMKAAGITPEDYEDLGKKRAKLVAEIKDIDKKLMADADAMKKINAVKRAFNDGNNAYKLGQYQQALTHYDKAISLDNTFYRAHYGKGLTLKKLRKYSEAIAAFKNTVEQNPAYTNGYLALGTTYSQLSQPDQAIQVYNTAIENDPSSAKIYYSLGEVYLNKKKNYRKAAENFTKATQINPTYDTAFLSLGTSLIELGKLNQAINALENAVAVTNRKKWEAPHYRLAVAYNKQGKFSKAKAAAIEALKNKRNYAPAAYEAGKAAKELGQFNEAIKYFRGAGKSRVWKKAADYEIDLIVNRDKYGSN